MWHRTIGRNYLMNEGMRKALQRITDDNSVSESEPDTEFHAETRSSLSDEDWIAPTETNEIDSFDGESIHNAISEITNFDQEHMSCL